MAALSRRAFLALIAAVPLARSTRKPPLRAGFGSGGFGSNPFGS